MTNVYLGQGTSSSSGFLNLTGLETVEVIKAEFGAWGYTAGTANVEIGFSSDGGGSWGASQSFGTINGTGMGRIIVNLRTGVFGGLATLSGAGGTMTVPANVNAVRFRVNASVGNARWVAQVLEGRV